MPAFRRNRMPLRKQTNFRSNQYTVLNGNSSQVQKCAIEINEYVFAYPDMLPIVDVQRWEVLLCLNLRQFNGHLQHDCRHGARGADKLNSCEQVIFW